MGRFSGGCACRRKSRSEIDVRAVAPVMVAITKSPCHQDRDSFDTISRIDIMGSARRGQTFLAFGVAVSDSGERTRPRRNPIALRYASSRTCYEAALSHS